MKLNFKKVGVIALTAILVVVATSCKKEGCTDPEALNYNEKAKKDDLSCTYAEEEEETAFSGKISSNTTWTRDNVMVIEGKVVVESGVTLTIESGTIIKAKTGTESAATALVVARGGKIMAEGTASAPIIFTSELDNIALGQTSGTSLDENQNGKWGGLIILGYAPISAGDGDDLSQIEGIPATEAYGAYGGSDVADNSGVLKYISIRHGGALIGAGNEINGLTLGGVGNGTTIDHIEVLANQDDGVECFGGTVNLSNVLVGYCGDDAIDLDQNYAGTITNFITIGNANSDEGLEVDGTEGTTHTDGRFTLQNGSVYAKDGARTPADFKDKAQGTISNVKFYNYTTNTIKIRTKYSDNCTTTSTDALSNLTAATPKLVFINCEFAEVAVYTASKADDTSDCPVKTSEQSGAEAAMTSTSSTGADVSVFTWSWISTNNKM
jgi:hypothetical protein